MALNSSWVVCLKFYMCVYMTYMNSEVPEHEGSLGDQIEDELHRHLKEVTVEKNICKDACG